MPLCTPWGFPLQTPLSTPHPPWTTVDERMGTGLAGVQEGEEGAASSALPGTSHGNVLPSQPTPSPAPTPAHWLTPIALSWPWLVLHRLPASQSAGGCFWREQGVRSLFLDMLEVLPMRYLDQLLK